MNDMTLVTRLPEMIRRAASTLAASSDAAEVLDIEAEMDAAWAASRAFEKMAKAQAAHDEVIRAAHKAQGDALDIKAAASKRYHEMTQAAIASGELQGRGGDRGNQHTGGKLSDQKFANPQRHYAVAHEGKLIAEAESRDPGVVRRAIDEALDEGRAPTKADIKRALTPSEMLTESARIQEKEEMDRRAFRAFKSMWRGMSAECKAMVREYIAAQ